ncbi:MAG: hypothetical protein L0229_18150 [Blastocatellia bacterium]|nr:hypothetical protein [Blastocatellia bacterium]
MPPVFDRDDQNPHPYDDALAIWLNSVESDIRSMARNLMHDHRVSREREKAFDSFFKHPAKADALQHAIDDYFKARVRTSNLPDFVLESLNRNNLLTGTGSLKPIIHKDVELVRTFDLNRLIPVYQWAMDRRNKKKKWRKCLAKFPIKPTNDEIDKWLDDEIGGGSEEHIEEMVATVLDIVNTYSLKQPFHPTWATTWAAFEPHKKHGPDRWLQVLGVAVPPPKWVILLKYTVAEAGRLVRPTMLDAGWYAYHFPSPRETPLSEGGHPMDIRIQPRANRLLPEYIHRQIQHPIRHWIDAGGASGAIGQTKVPDRESLTDQRKSHHELLASVYGTTVYSWMNSPD